MVRSDHGIPSLELPMRFYKTKPKRTPTAPRLFLVGRLVGTPSVLGKLMIYSDNRYVQPIYRISPTFLAT